MVQSEGDSESTTLPNGVVEEAGSAKRRTPTTEGNSGRGGMESRTKRRISIERRRKPSQRNSVRQSGSGAKEWRRQGQPKKAPPTTEERKRERLGDTRPQEAEEAAILTNALLACSESVQWKSFLKSSASWMLVLDGEGSVEHELGVWLRPLLPKP